MTSTAAARVLLLDLDGVVRRWPPDQLAAERKHGLLPGAIHAVAFDAVLLDQAVTGRIDDDAWRRLVRERLSLQVGDAAAADAVALWSESPGEVDSEVLTLIDEYALEVVLATNATSRLTDDLVRLGLADRFPRIANSAEVGAAKPDPAFFAAALDIAGAQATETLFVDDSATNVRAAAALGIRSHRYADPESLRRFLDAETARP